VIPTRNEVNNIGGLIAWLEDVLAEAHVDGDILVADDKSLDGTGKLVEILAKKHSNLMLYYRKGNTGLGDAYRIIFNMLLDCEPLVITKNYDTIVQMDGDLSHSPTDLPALLAKLEGNCCDLVIGSRYVQGGSIVGWTLRRQLISKGANSLARTVLRLKTHDITSGFRAWKVEALNAINISNTSSNGYDFMLEAVYLAERRKLKISEVPITFRERRSGQSKLDSKNVRKFFLLVFKLFMRDLIGEKTC
jgi:dolichol-phosphate mannosyltransferase